MKPIEWKCPKCGAKAHEHGPNRKERCEYNPGGKECEGFLCECSDEGGEQHGLTHADPCPEANCYCCGWGGTFPLPAKAKGWEKKALEAGWTPPEGWTGGEG